ncbi:ABC transporter permease subunit [Bacillus mangrovi]|uniref:ABC transporter permease subunit n=1 Tax=Metabacillus mangrovi TaxID=1491830 RepID=A0A7X2S6N7_9BACI|nr:ABC transporter permease [Metabacillus mangrovi]MTH54632.1 ABC transporter permease subunit [Metabacillus mangrovi]
MINLIYNEMIKIVRKKRLFIIMGIIAALAALFTYAQVKEHQESVKEAGTEDWRTQVQQEIINMQNRLNSGGISGEWKEILQIRVKQQQYYLVHDINPSAPGAPTFMKTFAENSIDLLLPLMVMVIASDLVSSEYTNGTVKLLLTRPVKRWKILMSKYITLLLAVSFIVLATGVLTYGVSGIALGYSGWTLPVLTGFSAEGGQLDTSAVQMMSLWQYILMDYGLVWFVAVIVGTLTFALSSLMKSTASVMGVMLASLIAGAILANMVSAWDSAKYLFMVNLNLTDYLTGMSPPIEGMSLGFSMTVLLVWAAAGLAASFFFFTRKDVY